MEEPSPSSSCGGCHQPITERYILKALGQTWHFKCFCCSVCKVQLSKECYTKGGRVYCKTHFSEAKNTKEETEIKEGCCAACYQPIPPNDLIRRAHGNIYHAQCFTCSICTRKISTGEEFYMKTDKKLLCKADYEAFKTKCVSCNQPIPPNHAMRKAQGNLYHRECFCCVVCKKQLSTGNEFYLRQDKKLLCKEDYEAAKRKIVADSDVVLSYGGLVGEEIYDGRKANYEFGKPHEVGSVMSNDTASRLVHEKMDDGGRKDTYQFANPQASESSDLVAIHHIDNPEFTQTGTES